MVFRLAALIALAALAQGQPAPEVIAQPRIGMIEFYGRRAMAESKLLEAAGVKPGDPMPASREDLEAKLIAIPGVVAAASEATCCVEGKAVLYIGIEERGAPHLDYHTPHSGDAAEALVLPEEIHLEYEGFLSAVALAVRAGTTDEDLSAGYSMMSHTGARLHQIHFLALAEKHAAQIRKVVRDAADNEQRAIAAYLVGYLPDKAGAAEDLQWAIRDSDPTVRNNAMRGLAALAIYAAKNPEAKLKVPATWFIEALNSLDWQDRVTAANILVTLTEGRDPAIFAQIRDRALPALVEMAGWKTLPPALPAFLVLGRMAGLAEADVEAQWSAGKRETVLAKFTQTKPAQKKK